MVGKQVVLPLLKGRVVFCPGACLCLFHERPEQEIVEIHPGEMKRIPTAFVSDLTPVMEIQMAELSIRVSNDADPELLVRTLAILRDLVC